MTHSFRQAIEETLPGFHRFGADLPADSPACFIRQWLQAQQAFKQKMSDSGLETRFDEVGNLYGRLPGTVFPTTLSSAVRILIASSTAVILTVSLARWRPGWRSAG